MFVEIVAAAAVAASSASGAQQPASQAGGATTVTPLVVAPLPKGDKGPPPAATIVMQTDDSAAGEFASAWPEAAYRSKTPGEVKLNCEIDRYGLAEWCDILSESPEGKGFGRAAMVLRPTFKVTPAMGPGGPIDSMMTIAIEFKPPDIQLDFIGGESAGQGNIAECGGGGSKPCPQLLMTGNPMQRRSVTMVDHPIWAEAASFADLAAVYPPGAGGVEGYAVAHCAVERSGSLTGCQITKEAPEKSGFGPAAVKLARRFRLAPQLVQLKPGAELWVDIPIRFPPPGAEQARTVASPTWTASYDPGTALKVFPPEAAAKGLTTGRGVARCVVAPDGALTDCTPETADPEGLGFSEVAAKLASSMKMNPWTSDAAPVDGAVVRVAIRLNLKPAGGG
jgi:TonB family protein